ncbi:MAG: energy-coupling factor transporter transmembrane protein EcfT [Clostridia bacterium]|nr:energy-coupling factor transporter transmembrane protein EcfT [Clostridia bacterium]
MIKDITLGQYFPGDSLLHRLDPRCKLILAVLYMVFLFMTQNPWVYLGLGLLLALFVLVSKIPVGFFLRGLKPVAFLIAFTAVFNLFFGSANAEHVYFSWGIIRITDAGIRQALLMAVRILLLVSATSLLTFTTTPILLTDALERLLSPLKKLGVPVYEFAMMMTIALRFIPTLIEEVDKIIKAQAARGADFDSGNLLQRAKSFVPVLVPLFISAFRRADDLATAMESRCYHGGEGRTRLRELRFARRDIVAFVFFALIGIGLILLLV